MKYILITYLLAGGYEQSAEMEDKTTCEAFGCIVVQDVYEVKSVQCVLAGEEA